MAKGSKGGGKSRLDNLSAACSNYLIPADVKNPFHHCIVKRTLQALRRAATLVGEVKTKAGKAQGTRRLIRGPKLLTIASTLPHCPNRTEAPSVQEASELSSAAIAKAAESMDKIGFFGALRWVLLFVMMVSIRFLACRSETLREIRLSHVSVVDDDDSPIGVALRIFLPKSKGDPLGKNGGAAMRAVSNEMLQLESRCGSIISLAPFPSFI